MENPTTQKYGPVSENRDYVDLVDIAIFFWRAKFYLIGGVILGIPLALLAGRVKNPPRYVVRVPMTIENPADLSSSDVITKFNQMLTPPDFLPALYDEIMNGGDPALKSSLGSSRVPYESFAELPNAQVGEAWAPFELLRGDGAGKFILQGRLRVSEDGAKVMSALAKSTGEAFGKLFEKTGPKESPEEIKKKAHQSSAEYMRVFALRAAEETPLRARLFGIESKLANRLGGVSGLPLPPDQDQISRLLGALLNSGKISSKEAEQIAIERSELIGKLALVEGKFSKLIATAVASLSVEPLEPLEVAQGAPGKEPPVPVLKVDSSTLETNLKAGAYQQQVSKVPTAVYMSGVILGGLFGVLVYAMQSFIALHRDRLKVALAKC